MRRKTLTLVVLTALLSGLLLHPQFFPDLAPDPVLADEANITLDGLLDTDYVKIASDPAGDLGAPAGWEGTHWTDLTDLYVAADATTLYVYASLPSYTSTVSSGQIGLVMDIDAAPNSGDSADPWDNAITFSYDHVDGTETTATMLPDYVIRGNVPKDGGWTELRAWDGSTWTGGGTNWGGISGGGQIGTHVAYSDTQGVEFSIPLADLGHPAPSDVHLQFFATQGGTGKGTYDTVPSDSQSTGWDDPTTQYQLVSVPLATDPEGDLASPGPADWSGTTWTDVHRLHVWADHANLHLFIPMPNYDTSNSTGQIGMTINTKSGGGAGDPWGNAITAAYTTTWQNLGYTPVVTTNTLLPDYYIRGNIYSSSDNGWTELRTWNGSNWDTGGGIDWGGIGNTGSPSQPNSKVAWSDGEGLRLTIPFADIGVSAGDTVDLEFFGTQGGGGKGAYDTVPGDDQSTGWDDATTQKVYASYTIPDIPSGAASQDDDVWWDGLYHDSRDPLYRSPVGAVVTGTTVTLRLRAFANDLTAAKVRIWDDRQDTQQLLDMSVVSSDGTYDWWEVDVPVGDDPTLHWYRFIAIDGTDTDYYEDDAERTMGVGQTFDESQDNSWQITVYNPAFQSPDWVKNAVIYQIFTDRFRDGDPTNNTPAGSFHYNLPDGSIVRSTGSDWNTPICDPRDTDGDCPNKYGENFYGGDLQGIIDKLDYLDDLGVTALYLNPIFESPSNHKYDTTDFGVIDDNFGDLSTYITLTTEAANRGMHVILDGVFNHTSSDSIYFDRYSRFDADGNLTSPDGPGINDGSGACESPDSPYRDWYYFTDVTPGSGECVGSDGTPNAATYESWFGYDSLPKLKADNAEVRAMVWTSGTTSIAPYWISQGGDGWRLDVAGDVDPGVTNDPTNDYWEGFRAAVRDVYSDTYIVGEEWGNSTPWLIAPEWDASMNYQFGTAIMGFWRDSTFTDNDHNASSSAGVIEPLTPSELDERLHYLEERYPPEAFYAMMNLLGSHDTNRALFMLDHNAATGTDDTLLDDPNYDWSDAITRLKGVWLLQMTLPGAPTTYYGDEVGLVGPTTYAGGKWEDDPYNRLPYPWLDESGTPFYTHLQSQATQDDLRDYYKLLTDARNDHPALRTGDFETLLVDDDNAVYAYGRKKADHSDAAVIIANSGSTSQTVTVDVAGYLGAGTVFIDVLDGGAVYTVTTSGEITVPDVPAMSGAVLVLNGTMDTPPDAVTDLSVTNEGSGELTLGWSAATGADSYILYRSQVSGGGYTPVVTTTSTVYTDTGLTNATTYYYVVVSRDDTTLLKSGTSNEASGMPHDTIGWANLQWPPEITHTIGITPTENIYGQVWIDGVTSDSGATPGLTAQVGFGPTTTQPISWTMWVDAEFNTDAGNNDEFKGQLVPEETGEFYYVYRYTTTNGRSWTYADQSGVISADNVISPGLLHVQPAADTTPPATPQNLRVTNWSVGSISLAWDAVTDTDLYAYDLFRYGEGETSGEAVKVGRVLSSTTAYTDTTVTTGQTYTYTVRALDRNFNASTPSNEASATAEARLVELRFHVTVPDYTPLGDTIYIAGNDADAFGSAWNASGQALTPLSATEYVYTTTVADGTDLEYKYTRGSWETVENWGTLVGLTNRKLTAQYGATGVMTVTDTVHNWRDPIVIDHYPAVDAATWTVSRPISVTFNRPLDTSRVNTSTFKLEGGGHAHIDGEFGFAQTVETHSDPVYGTVNVTGTLILYTPTLTLDPAHGYTIALLKAGYYDDTEMRSDYIWSFGAEHNLAIDKQVALEQDPPEPGDALTYTIQISNTGYAPALNVHVTDTLPSGVTGMDLDEVITVTANGLYSFTLPATIDADTWGATITNTAAYSHTSGSGQAQTAFTVVGAPALDLTKSVTPETNVALGDVVTYTLTLVNNGEAEAMGVHLTDTLPSEITFGGFTAATNVSPVYASGTITWSGALPSGVQPIAIVYTATVGSAWELHGVTITNTAHVTSLNNGQDSAMASFTIEPLHTIYMPLIFKNGTP
ncbi:MAG: alpha-amylase family glycosyl hydrolase [Anaerolineae bacterium]